MNCVEQACMPQLQDCDADPLCAAHKVCRDSCSDPNCLRTCQETAPAPIRWNLLQTCMGGATCQAQCLSGMDFACAGGYQWPATPGRTEVELSLVLINGAVQPIEGVTVSACSNEADRLCMNPVASAVSGLGGLVALQIPVTATGGVFEGFVRISGAPIPATTLFFSHPLSHGRTTMTVRLVDNTEWLSLAIPPDRGFLEAHISDCRDVSASGVSLTATAADSMAIQWALASDGTTRATTNTLTTSAGVAGFFSFPAVPTTVFATQPDSAFLLSEVDGFVNPAEVSVFTLRPRTLP